MSRRVIRWIASWRGNFAMAIIWTALGIMYAVRGNTWFAFIVGWTAGISLAFAVMALSEEGNRGNTP